MPNLGPGATGSAREQAALRVSLAAAAVIGVVAIAWGLWASAAIIIFDGAYACLGILLTWLSLRASRLVAAGPTRSYPFGREALAPLVIFVQGLALMGTCLYAIVDSVMVILDGGSSTAVGPVLAYGFLSAIASMGVWAFLRTYARSSELVAAEATQWLAATLMSIGMFVAFTAAHFMSGTDLAHLIVYLDPALVILASGGLLPAPWRMLRTTVRELGEGAPPEDVQRPVLDRVAEVTAQEGLQEPTVRMSKLGSKLYVEIDYLVEAGQWDTSDADRVRRAMTQRMDELPYSVWLNLDLSTDPSWGQ